MKASWIIDQLVAQGVLHFCTAPGSRSTPLVCAALEHPKPKVHTHFDERGVGFFALGIAKASQKPTAIIVTSGTAVGNLLPSIMEASHASIPLIVLTADRPSRLIDCGANQATDQTKIFSSFVRWETSIDETLNEESVRSKSAQSIFYALQNPPGPIHINCPFDEPLYQPNLPRTKGKPVHFSFPTQVASAYQTNASQGLILVGKLPKPDDIKPILELGKRLQWPIFADILSNGRNFPTKEQIYCSHWEEKPIPDLVLHFGERLTSKSVPIWLKKIQTEVIHISPYPHLQDPEQLLPGRVQSDILPFCQTFQANCDSSWLAKWRAEVPSIPASNQMTEAKAMQELSEIVPETTAIFLGNGMPIRDADAFLFPKKCLGFFANRGLSGIDGNIACIAGLAEKQPVFAIIGDQTALYDLNSLPLIKKTKHPVILLIFNNFGGGIFHHLPISASPYFETHWASNHDYHFETAAKLFDIPYLPFDQIKNAFEQNRSQVIELITNRKENHVRNTSGNQDSVSEQISIGTGCWSKRELTPSNRES